MRTTHHTPFGTKPQRSDRRACRSADTAERSDAEHGVPSRSDTSMHIAPQLRERIAVWENEGGAIYDVAR